MTPDELKRMLESGDPYVFGAKPTGVTAKDFVSVPSAPAAAPPTFLHPGYRKLPVKNQQGGTCVGNSIALCMELLEYAETKRIIQFDGEELNARFTHVEGAASMPGDILDIVQKYGIEGQAEGTKAIFLPKAYARLDHTNIEAVKQAMSTPGQIVTVAIWIKNDFGSDGGKTYLEYDGGETPGYHEVTLVGYDEHGVIVQNSWDTWWGDGGFFRLAWSYITSNWCGECWVITDNADTAGGYIRTYSYDVNAKERAIKHKAVGTNTRPAVYLVKGNGRIWIKDPFEAKRFGVNLFAVEQLDDTNGIWALPVIGPDAPVNLR